MIASKERRPTIGKGAERFLSAQRLDRKRKCSRIRTATISAVLQRRRRLEAEETSEVEGDEERKGGSISSGNDSNCVSDGHSIGGEEMSSSSSDSETDDESGPLDVEETVPAQTLTNSHDGNADATVLVRQIDWGLSERAGYALHQDATSLIFSYVPNEALGNSFGVYQRRHP